MWVLPDERYATLEAIVLSGEKVRFATGIVTHSNLKTNEEIRKKGEKATFGLSVNRP